MPKGKQHILKQNWDWLTEGEWTDQHYALAKQILRSKHILPHKLEDVMQEVALHHPQAVESWRRGKRQNPRAWFGSVVCNRAKTMYRKDKFKRGHRSSEDTPKEESVDLEEVLDEIPNEAHSADWCALVRHAVSRDRTISGSDLSVLQCHCLECPECEDLFFFLPCPTITIDVNRKFVSVDVHDFADDSRTYFRTTARVLQLAKDFIRLDCWKRKQGFVRPKSDLIEYMRSRKAQQTDFATADGYCRGCEACRHFVHLLMTEGLHISVGTDVTSVTTADFWSCPLPRGFWTTDETLRVAREFVKLATRRRKKHHLPDPEVVAHFREQGRKLVAAFEHAGQQRTS